MQKTLQKSYKSSFSPHFQTCIRRRIPGPADSSQNHAFFTRNCCKNKNSFSSVPYRNPSISPNAVLGADLGERRDFDGGEKWGEGIKVDAVGTGSGVFNSDLGSNRNLSIQAKESFDFGYGGKWDGETGKEKSNGDESGVLGFFGNPNSNLGTHSDIDITTRGPFLRTVNGTVSVDISTIFAKGKLGLANVGGVLRNHKGEVLFMFSKHVGIKDSNEAEVLAILEALYIYHSFYHHNLIVESDSANAISIKKHSAVPLLYKFRPNYIQPNCNICRYSQRLYRSYPCVN